MTEPGQDQIDSESDGVAIGKHLHDLMRDLYPICRSITGNGVRKTLRRLSDLVPIEVHEVASGTPVLDWKIPLEWNINDAYIKDSTGKRVVDFKRHNLHVLNYSSPIHQRMSLAELRPHLHTLPDHPDWIPYRTSYYTETWGFCLSENQLRNLPDGEYEVRVDSTLEPGHLTYGEFYLPGETEEEILISTHICHPSLCNDNLSGLATSIHLAKALSAAPPRSPAMPSAQPPHHYSYRFLFVPGTIGSITWLARNRETVDRIAHGLTLVNLGDGSAMTYKKTFGGEAEVDHVVPHVLAERGDPPHLIDFFPYGYDERQFNSPGFRLPIGSLMRGRHGEFPEYHTSADNLDFVLEESLTESYDVCMRIIDVLNGNRRYRNLSPYGEPQLGRRGIYRIMGGENDPGELQMAILWTLMCSDGEHSLLEIAQRSGTHFDVVRRAALLLVEHDLLELAD